jgi:hypothetical protein
VGFCFQRQIRTGPGNVRRQALTARGSIRAENAKRRAMISKNKPMNGLDVRYRGNLATSTWCLCVGAGISNGLIPTWQELTRRVVNQAFDTEYDVKQFELLVSQTRWSLDALLQGAANRLALGERRPEQFGELLEKALYEDLLAQANGLNLESSLRSALSNPRWLKREKILGLANFFESHHGNSTLVQLAKALAVAREASKEPHAIINFNADTLLFALLDMFLIREHAKRVGRWDHPSYSYQKTLRGIEGVPVGATPIFHCHGAIAPRGDKKKEKRPRDSREHLVFTEADYLSIAGNVATWAQSLFLFHAQSSRFLILGHSLADPNIRKWLAWSFQSSMAEMEAISRAEEVTPRHIWLAKRPKDDSIRKIQEISLLHLGVRPCWLGDWTEVQEALENLLAL